MSDIGLLQLHPLVQRWAAMPDDVYEAFQKSNPSIAWAVDKCREVMGE